MTISDETLMAYADGELDAAARAAVELAMREDPQIEKRVAAHRTLRRKVQAAYSAELSEGIPERLLTAARAATSTHGSKVVNLQHARAAMERSRSRARPLPTQWRTAGTIAASVIAGVGLGFFMWGHTESPLVRSAGGALVARGQLAKALSNQLAADQSRSSAVQIGVSFRAKSGDYCRTFALSGAVSPSGLACRHGERWQVQALTQEPGTVSGSDYRTAGSAMSATILKSVEGQIAGEPLDQAGERAARQRGWTATDR
jgi:NAD/NADP transhydrogenase alpha subunit